MVLRMIHPAVICFLFFMVSTINSQLVKDPFSHPPLLEISSIFNDTSHDLKNFEYSNIAETQAIFNCSSFVNYHEYLLLENGSLLVPGSESAHEYGSYRLKNGTAILCGEEDTAETAEVSDLNLSKDFLECSHLLIDPEEYRLLENGDIYIGIYSKTYSPGDYYLQTHGVYICIPDFDKMVDERNMSSNETFSQEVRKFSPTFTYVTNIGLSVSIVCLLSHLIVFCAVSSIRNLPGCCLASLSLSLLMAYLCFLIAATGVTASACIHFGITVYYFFISSFFWMNAIAFDVWRSFRAVTRELRLSSHRVPWRRFLAYSVFSWLIPGMLTILIKIFDSTDILPEDLRPSFGTGYCWFGNRKALLFFFAVPLIVIMVLNAVFFMDVTYVISRATLRTSQSYEATLKKRFFMFTRLALIMGLTWIVGLIAGYADYTFLWYLFIILNTLQGLFIFIVFSCSSKVRVMFLKKYRNSKTSQGSSSVRTISQISAAV